MADEIDAGRIVAEIVLETQQARESAEEISDKFEEINSKKINPTVMPQVDKETLGYIIGSLKEMGITGRDMINVLNAGFSNLTVARNYRNSLEEIALKIDECRTKMQALNVGDNIDSGAVENYSDALTQLEEQYDKVLAKLDAYVAKTVATVQRAKDIENEINELSGLNPPKVVDNNTMLQAQSYEDTIIYIREVLEKLKITGKQADDIISACFQDVSSLRKYQNELEVIQGKLDAEKKKYLELTAAKNRAEKRGDYSAADKITSAMDDQVNKIKTLEARFYSVYEKQNSAVKKAVDAYQKQSSAAQNAQVKQDKLNKALDNKQAGKNFAGGVNLATTSLRTFNSIAPDAVDGIGEIITQVNAAKQAMTAGASAPIAWGTAIIAGIGIVASLVINEIQKVQQAEEEARKKAAEAASEYENNKNELKELSEQFVSLRSKLDNVNLSREEEIEIKSELYQMQDEFIKKYGLEAESIDLVTGSIKEQTAAIEERKESEALELISKSGNEYFKYKDEFEKQQKYTISVLKTFEGKSDLGDISYDKLQEINDELNKRLSKTGGVQSEIITNKINGQFTGEKELVINVDVEGENAKEKFQNILKEIRGISDQGIDGLSKKITQSYSSAYGYYFDDKFDERQNIWSSVKNAYDVLEGTAEDTSDTEIKKLAELNEQLGLYKANMDSLSSAYQTVTQDGKISGDTLQSLCEKYPELAEYVHETGDTTFKNGELIKNTYESEQDAANEAINAEIARLNALRASGEATPEQEKEFFRLRNMVSMYNNDIMDLQSAIDVYTDKMNNLSSAYKAVSDGGEIDSKTLENLIAQYPELAEYISQTGDLTLDNGEKIKEAYKKEKQALIEKLEIEKSELEFEKESSDSKDEIARQISQINAQLEIYKSFDIDNDNNVDWSSIAGEVKNLASAYQTLNEGKQLDVDTMIQLIDKYPEVASKMAQTGKLGKEQANVFKELAEAKKNDYVVGQQVALKNLEVSRQETVGIIKNLNAQLQMYVLKGQIMQAMNLLPQIAKQKFNLDDINSEIDKAKARIKAIKSIDIDTYGKGGSGSGGGSDRNEALSNELKRLEHKKAIGQLTSKQEYDWLVKINNKYRKNSDEQMDMEKRLYNARKQMIADEEAANAKALQAAYKGIENKKSLGKLTSQQELQQLEQIRKKYKMTAEERMELEIKIYNLKKSIKDDEISSLNTLGDAVTEALKEKYEEQRKAEEERINESIESWKTWEDKTVEAIQGQIDALDELADKQESENKRQEYENKRQQTQLQLAYEKDDYNRVQLQKELNRLDKEEAERLAEEQREAQKKSLQEQMDAVKEKSSQQQEKLQKQLDKVGETYDKMTDTFALKAQAQKFIANNTQKQIVELIKSYASDYEVAGQTIGDALYRGMKSKTNDIEKWVNNLFSGLTSYQRKVAVTANNAADRFWANRNSYQQSITQMSAPKTVQVKQTVQFNKPVESPVEIRRQLDRTNQALAKQISNGL